MISGREWCDFISFSHGLPMMVHRVERDEDYIAAIYEAAKSFEQSVLEIIETFRAATADASTYTPTERIDYEGMIL
jgi:hypothetical protein